ncbi:hypothetical protein R1flu_001665 [Riccia fluitans]|uniref:Uncharacterized protein n=1 Tax=Riccia fluitans TaxID=41844 RepID=A0ABD1Y428_9MARC
MDWVTQRTMRILYRVGPTLRSPHCTGGEGDLWGCLVAVVSVHMRSGGSRNVLRDDSLPTRGQTNRLELLPECLPHVGYGDYGHVVEEAGHAGVNVANVVVWAPSLL